MSKSFNSSTGSSSSAAAGANNTRPRRFPDGIERPANTPFCKVCFDAGHPLSEYTDHFVKNIPGPNGEVICPTLLNQNCRICKKPGHTSTYCAEYRPRRDERERERETPRYIEREREYEPRRYDDERERETPRYIEREREPRHDDRDSRSFNRLREDTDRHEREIRDRNDAYDREQDRRSKPWLQAALVRPSSSTQQQHRERRGPYAHPHGPRVRLELESRALSSATAAATAATPALPVIDFRKVDLHHAAAWGDEEPGEMAGQFFEELSKQSMTNSVSCVADGM
jgi:hypothetical protein